MRTRYPNPTRSCAIGMTPRHVRSQFRRLQDKASLRGLTPVEQAEQDYCSHVLADRAAIAAEAQS